MSQLVDTVFSDGLDQALCSLVYHVVIAWFNPPQRINVNGVVDLGMKKSSNLGPSLGPFLVKGKVAVMEDYPKVLSKLALGLCSLCPDKDTVELRAR
jgi:hypothetical protein